MKAVQSARSGIIQAKKAAATRRNGLKFKVSDRNNGAAAIERAEISTHLRGLQPMQLVSMAETTGDVRILEAMLSAPPELSGITPDMKVAADRIERRYLTMINGAVIDEIEAEETAVASAEAVLLTVLGEIQTTAGLAPHEFEREVVISDQRAGAPWLQKEGDRIVRAARRAISAVADG